MCVSFGTSQQFSNDSLPSLPPLFPSCQQILVPNAVSWLAMWCSSLVIAYGLRQKEKQRDLLLASGAVWTYHEQVSWGGGTLRGCAPVDARRVG